MGHLQDLVVLGQAALAWELLGEGMRMHMERVRKLVAEGEHTQVYRDLEHTRPAVVHIVEEEGIVEHHTEGDTVVAEGTA